MLVNIKTPANLGLVLSRSSLLINCVLLLNANNVTVEPVKSVEGSVVKSVVEPNTCGVVLKTMTPEEQKVLNVLVAHQGKYLQKYVSKEAGLSRLKTHRIVARFAQRGIVTVNEFGNTNEIVVSDWVATSR